MGAGMSSNLLSGTFKKGEEAVECHVPQPDLYFGWIGRISADRQRLRREQCDRRICGKDAVQRTAEVGKPPYRSRTRCVPPHIPRILNQGFGG